MTTEELLIKRVKVITNYPVSIYSIGDILYEVDRMLQKFVLKDDDRNFKYIQYPQDYPAIFEPLPWWKERKIEDMPEYLECKSPVFKFSKGDVIKVDKWLESFGPVLRFYSSYTDKITLHPMSFVPATREEYEAYLQATNPLNNRQ